MSRTSLATPAAIGLLLAAAAGAAAQPCAQPAGHCQSQFQQAIQVSVPTGPVVADDFSPAESGEITSLCVTGIYATPFGPCSSTLADNFRVRYYQSVNGLPGPIVAEFSQADSTLTVAPPTQTGNMVYGVVPELAFTLSHAPVAVEAGACYWLEVTNEVAGQQFCNWHWTQSASGDGEFLVDGSFGSPDGYSGSDILFGDMSFCLSIPLGPSGACLPPREPNETCDGAIELACGQTVYANNEPRQPFDYDLPPTYGCGNWSTSGILNSLWYRMTATSESAVLEVGGDPALDSVLAVYSGSCGNFVEVDCSDNHDPFGNHSRVVLRNLEIGQTYYILLGSYPFTMGGDYTLTLTCSAPEPPANDACHAAAAVEVGATVVGSNENATHDVEAVGHCMAARGPIRGVWYRVAGTGTTMTASTCLSETLFDTEIRVFCADCGDLRCVASSADNCGPLSETSWCSQAGAEYLILVSGGNGDTGVFTLTILADGTPCEASIDCAPAGGCAADWDEDQQVNSNDISAFLTSWLQSVQDGALDADFDQSGAVNSNDISAFLTAWLEAVQSGC